MYVYICCRHRSLVVDSCFGHHALLQKGGGGFSIPLLKCKILIMGTCKDMLFQVNDYRLLRFALFK